MRLLIVAIVALGAMAAAPAGVQEDGAVMVGAGDISSCDNDNDSATGNLIEQIEGTVFIPGDIAYPDGTDEQFAECYGPAWGNFKDRTRPAPGNHEYNMSEASGYYSYFGAAAGDPAKGYYSYDVGDWHIVALNSNCDEIEDDGCGGGSAQERWLRSDLADNPSMCTMAYWHHPRFSSGTHGSDDRTQAFWQALYEHGADVVVVGHDHDYERFAPMDPAGQIDHPLGIRQFVVGTGGRSLRDFEHPIRAYSEVRNSDTYGVIKFLLQADSYTWAFVPIDGEDFTDSGRASCHGPPSVIPTPVLDPPPEAGADDDRPFNSLTLALLMLAAVVIIVGSIGLAVRYLRRWS